MTNVSYFYITTSRITCAVPFVCSNSLSCFPGTWPRYFLLSRYVAQIFPAFPVRCPDISCFPGTLPRYFLLSRYVTQIFPAFPVRWADISCFPGTLPRYLLLSSYFAQIFPSFLLRCPDISFFPDRLGRYLLLSRYVGQIFPNFPVRCLDISWMILRWYSCPYYCLYHFSFLEPICRWVPVLLFYILKFFVFFLDHVSVPLNCIATLVNRHTDISDWMLG